MDIFRSPNGVSWEKIGEDIFPLKDACAGYGFARIGEYFMYYPTEHNPPSVIGFKTYRSKDLLNWEYCGSEYDVQRDERYYSERWDELMILKDKNEDDEITYYGYISSEVRSDVGEPSCGMLKSKDGLKWDILPPPVISWGNIASHHMEVCFCEKMGDKYYLCMSGRLYLDSMGYSLYTFVADKPEGPYNPDVEMFRLYGMTSNDITWLGHTFAAPDGILCTMWLSHDEPYEIPSQSFTIAPLKLLYCDENGHIRLKYWQGNDKAKKTSDTLNIKDKRYLEDGMIKCTADRNGVLVMFDCKTNKEKGFILEGNIKLSESRKIKGETHYQSAHFGIYLESGENEGVTMVADTHGVMRTGYVKFCDRKISDYAFRDDSHCMQEMMKQRAGEYDGKIKFDCKDTTGPFGHANFSTIRHNTRHTFRLILKGDYFELYTDDFYVQTFIVPETFTGKIGMIVYDGTAVCDNLILYDMDL